MIGCEPRSEKSRSDPVSSGSSRYRIGDCPIVVIPARHARMIDVIIRLGADSSNAQCSRSLIGHNRTLGVSSDSP